MKTNTVEKNLSKESSEPITQKNQKLLYSPPLFMTTEKTLKLSGMNLWDTGQSLRETNENNNITHSLHFS